MPLTGSGARYGLSVSTKNTLGAISTLFNINDEARKDILDVLNNKKPAAGEDEEGSEHEDVSILKEDIKDKSIDGDKKRKVTVPVSKWTLPLIWGGINHRLLAVIRKSVCNLNINE